MIRDAALQLILYVDAIGVGGGLMRDINDYSKNYSVQDFELYQVEYRRKMVMEQINKYQPYRILEIGCGREPLFEHVKGKEWVIVEPSESFCQIAEKKAEACDHVRILQGFFEEQVPCIRRENFDMIICSGLLNEVEEPEEMLKGILECCGEETIVHINVSNSNSFHRILAKHMGIIEDEHDKSQRNILFQQNTVFDMDKLSKMVLECHFEVLDQGSYFVKPFTHKQMYELIEMKIIDKKVLDGLYSMASELPMMGSEIFINCRKQPL